MPEPEAGDALPGPNFTLGKPLPAHLLYRRCDPAQLPFAVCTELDAAPGPIGQERAVEAIRFAMRIRHKGYNVYVLGASGGGRHSLVDELLRSRAASEPAPPDWCYVNNFTDPQRPHCLQLPTGRGVGLAAAMTGLVRELRAALPTAFERDEYQARRELLDQQFKQRSEQAFGALQQRAETKSISLLRTQSGLALAPNRDGKVLTPELFEQLPTETREQLQHDLETLQSELEAIIQQVPRWEREHRETLRDLDRETTGFAIAHLMEELRADYSDLPEVTKYLDAVERDIRENTEEFLSQLTPQPGAQPPPVSLEAAADDARFRRYRVNVLVDNSALKGAPVIYEDNPTHQTLVGRVEHLARFGALVTDFNLLLPGALHRANRGYLIIDAEKLLAGKYGWESLARTLNAGEIRIETLEQLLSVASTVSLSPEPIPLDVKIVLIGSPELYHQLSVNNEEFGELFKIAAEFDDRIERSPETTLLYARLVCAVGRREGLRPLDRDAVARVIEHAARMAGDAESLSTNLRSFVDLLQEADQIAADTGKDLIGEAEVHSAIAGQIRRSDRIYRRLQDQIARKTMRIEVSGEQIGQINGLSVVTLGKLAFGTPSRITAQVRLGRGEVVDIEREVALGGPLHSKGVLILVGFLGGRFGQSRPLSLNASLVFEQSYGGVDGDSASAAELFSLLSALAEAPLKQCYAVTGSIDQRGQIQAIGGVNEKIEGFFDACRAIGFSGNQGVVIPAANVKHLMLRRDVVEAAGDGRFAVVPIDSVDEGLELLTGIPAGQPDAGGNYPSGTLNQRIAARLDQFAAKAAEFARNAADLGSRG